MSADAATVRRLHPENPRIQRLGGDDRVIVSEPIAELPGLWTEVPESSVIVVQRGRDEQRSFTPRPPVQRAAHAVTGVSLDPG